jgi:GABA(A) receptor-associated protein
MYKKTYSKEERIKETMRILKKYPDKVPIICERSLTTSPDCPYLDKNKYLVPRDFTMGQFVYVIRKRMALPPEKAIFLFIGNTVPHTSQVMSTTYDTSKDEDGFLYVNYSFENTFG